MPETVVETAGLPTIVEIEVAIDVSSVPDPFLRGLPLLGPPVREAWLCKWLLAVEGEKAKEYVAPA